VTAVLLCPPGADEATWLQARRAGIGASEIAAVLGISPYASPFSLYWAKANGWEIEDTGDMEAGRRMENAIADWAADRIDPNEQLRIVPAGLYQSAERPWQLATPDRLIYMACVECGGDGLLGDLDVGLSNCPACTAIGHTGDFGMGKLVAVLEVKHPYSWDGFGEDGTDEIPVYFRTQLLQQMDVMEVSEGYLAAYCGHELRVYHLRRDDKDIAVMRAAGAAFWQRLQDGIVPDLDGHSETIAALRKLHPSLGEGPVEVTAELAEGYRQARADRKAADVRVKECEAQIRAALGSTYSRAECNGKLVASRSVFAQSEDWSELAAIDDEWPTIDRLNPGRSASYA